MSAVNVDETGIVIGRPLGIGGLTDATKVPAFAAAAGLLVYPQFASANRVGRAR